MKSRIGILTDDTAQYTVDKFSGNHLVHTLPISIDSNSLNSIQDKNEQKQPLAYCTNRNNHPATEEDIRKTLLCLNEKYNEVIIPVLSKQINPLYYLIEESIAKLPNSASFHLVDSQTIAIGLGIIVQIAAGSASRNIPIDDIKQKIRSAVPKIYSIFCVKNLSYLYWSGLIDLAQAVVGEYLGLSPCLCLETGRLIPMHKAKNLRHCIDLFWEFALEFDNINNIALIYGDGFELQDFHILRSRINHHFSTATFSEHKINKATSSILGPQTIGLVIMEDI